MGLWVQSLEVWTSLKMVSQVFLISLEFVTRGLNLTHDRQLEQT
jgi:hypothetical protein